MGNCVGCEHGYTADSDELGLADPDFDADSLFGGTFDVNSINPGAASPPGPYEPWATWVTDPATQPPTWSYTKGGGDSGRATNLTITLSSFWFTGWHGSCQKDSSTGECIESSSCVVRLYLRWRVKVEQVFNPTEKPTLPTMPVVEINSTAPSTVGGHTVIPLASPGEDPIALPPDQVGTVTQEHGNPLPTVVNSPGASVGFEHFPNGSVWAYRDYYVESIYRADPGCDVTQFWHVELDDWVIDIDGEPAGPGASEWNGGAFGSGGIIEPSEADQIDVTVDCYNCAEQADPPPDGTGPITPGKGKNQNPNSIGQ